VGVVGMTEGRYREEVFNVVLAQLLHGRGVVSAPEGMLRRVGRQLLVTDQLYLGLVGPFRRDKKFAALLRL